MHIPDSTIAAYPEYAQESIGGPRFPVYPVINDAPSASTSLPTVGYSPLLLGQCLVDRYGHWYIYVRTNAALVAGQIVTKRVNPTEGAVITADAVADNIHVIKVSIAGLTANSEKGNFLAINNTTGPIQDLKLILANTATVAGNAYVTISERTILFGRGGFDANAPAAAYATAGSEVSLVRPYHVEVCGLDGAAMGVAMGTVTSGNNTIVQISGLAQCKGVAATTFADNAQVYTKAAGEVSVTASAGLAVVAIATVGLSKSAYGGASSALVPVWLMDIYSRW